jgi:hypothetical protein
MTDRIHHGAARKEPINETGLVVTNIQFSAKRNHKETLNKDRQVAAHTSRTPQLDIELKGQPIPTSLGAYEGLAVAHPGIAVTLINFNGTNNESLMGFTSASGSKVVVKDVSLTLDEDADPEMTVPCTFYPELADFSSATN